MSAAKVTVKRSTITSANMGGLNWSMLLGVIFLVMAVLQLISFSSFKDWLGSAGFSGVAAWAIVIILVEVIAALNLIRIALPSAVKTLSWGCALLASGFWFIENLRFVSDAMTPQLTNSGFFGKYLMQPPSWWTVLEVTILLLWTIAALDDTKL